MLKNLNFKKNNSKYLFNFTKFIVMIAVCMIFTAGELNIGYREVIDVCPELKSLWLGSDNAETGKKIPQDSILWVEFNKEIDIEYLRDALRIEFQKGGNNPRGTSSINLYKKDYPMVPINLFYPNELWTTEITNSNQMFPADFNVVTFSGISGIPHIEGPAATGGSFNTNNMCVNNISNQEIGLIAENGIDITNGQIHGDLYYSGNYNLTNINVIGNTNNNIPVDFTMAKQKLTSLSTYLNSIESNGTSTFQYGSLKLQGNDSALNIFEVNSNDLSLANYIEISVPQGSAVLLNVIGTAVKMGNMGINIQGSLKENILWNMPNTISVSLSGISFPGSLLAPGADIDLNNGNLEGTLIAESLTGNGEFHYFPFNSWDVLAELDSENKVYFWWDNEIDPDVIWTLIIENKILTSEGYGLEKLFLLDFMVYSKNTDIFTAETNSVIRSSSGISSFEINDGFNITPEELFERYSDNLGLNLNDDTFIKTIEASPNQISPEYGLSFYQQEYKGIPVMGYGYFILEDNGYAKAITGSAASDLDINLQSNISEESAYYQALSQAASYPLPWESQPDIYKKPEVKQILTSLSSNPEADDFILVWRVDFKGSGIRYISFVDVNAQDSSIVRIEKSTRYCNPEDLTYVETAESIAQYTQGTDTINVNFDSEKYIDGDTQEHFLLHTASSSGVNIFTHVGTPSAYMNDVACSHDDNLWNTNDEKAQAFIYNGAINAMNFIKNSFHVLPDDFNPGSSSTTLSEPWLGTDGKGNSILRIIVDNSTEWESNSAKFWDDSVNHQSPLIYYNTDYFHSVGSDTDELTKIRQADLSIAHEYGHAVLDNGRARYGLDSIISEGESGAIIEAFSEIIARLAFHNKYPDSAWTQDLPINDIPFTDPKSEGYPSTYSGENWQVPTAPFNESNDYGFIHSNSSIITHWFYLMVEGKDIGENDVNQKYTVQPFSADTEESLRIAQNILFYAATRLLQGENPGIEDLANATKAAADWLYPDAEDLHVLRTVQQAWYAVGIYTERTVDPVLPINEHPSITPWPVNFSWYADLAGTWQIEIATSPDYTSDFDPSNIVYSAAVEADIDPSTGLTTEDGLPLTSVSVELRPDTIYHWRVRPESSSEWNEVYYKFETQRMALEVETYDKNDVHYGIYVSRSSINFMLNSEYKALMDITPEEFTAKMEIYDGSTHIATKTLEINTFSDYFCYTYNLRTLYVDGEISGNKAYDINVTLEPNDTSLTNRIVEPLDDIKIAFPLVRLISPGFNSADPDRDEYLNHNSTGATFTWEPQDVFTSSQINTKLIIKNLLINSDPYFSEVVTPYSIGDNLGYTFNNTKPTEHPKKHGWSLNLYNKNNGNMIWATVYNQSISYPELYYVISLDAPEITYPSNGSIPSFGEWETIKWKIKSGEQEYKLIIWERNADGSKKGSPVYNEELHWCMDPIFLRYGTQRGVDISGLNLDNFDGYTIELYSKHQSGVFVNYDTYSFKFDIEAPEIDSPSNNSTFLTTDSIIVEWNHVAGAESYIISYGIKNSGNYTDVTVNATGSSVLSKSLSLTTAGTYSIQITAVSNTGEESEEDDITVIVEEPITTGNFVGMVEYSTTSSKYDLNLTGSNINVINIETDDNVFQAHYDNTVECGFGPNNDIFVCATDGTWIVAKDLAKNKNLINPETITGSYAWSFSPDGKILLRTTIFSDINGQDPVMTIVSVNTENEEKRTEQYTRLSGAYLCSPNKDVFGYAFVDNSTTNPRFDLFIYNTETLSLEQKSLGFLDFDHFTTKEDGHYAVRGDGTEYKMCDIQ